MKIKIIKKKNKSIDITKKTKSDGNRIKYFFISGLIIFSLSYLFYKSEIFSLLLVGNTIPLEKVYINYEKKKEREILRWQFKDALYSLSSSFATGRQLQEALKEALLNLRFFYGSQEPIIKALNHMVKQMEIGRANEEAILFEFGEESKVKEIREFAEVYSVCKSTGGDMCKAVNKSAELLTERIISEQEIRTMVSQKKYEMGIICSLSIFILLFLNLTAPDYVEGLYTTFLGRILMTVALIGIVVSYLVSEKIMEQ